MGAKVMFIDLKPVSKPRQTRADVWKKRPCVVRYREFADGLRAQVDKKYEGGIENFRREVEAQGLSCTFWFEPPKSWSKKKRDAAIFSPHTTKPDLDNLTKAVKDALFEEDSRVWMEVSVKKWGVLDGISLSTIFEEGRNV